MQQKVRPRCSVVNGFLWLTTLDHETCHLECLRLKMQTQSWPTQSLKKDRKRLSFKVLCPRFDMKTLGWKWKPKEFAANYTLAEPRSCLRTTMNYVMTDQQCEHFSHVSIIVHKHWTIVTVLTAPIPFCSQFLPLRTLSLFVFDWREWDQTPPEKCKTLCLQSHQLKERGVVQFWITLSKVVLFIPS